MGYEDYGVINLETKEKAEAQQTPQSEVRKVTGVSGRDLPEEAFTAVEKQGNMRQETGTTGPAKQMQEFGEDFDKPTVKSTEEQANEKAA